ncbi:xanthine dehydrogenase accessory protein XdhC [Pseudoalteromonas denitrificans]|jgi:xanthine dehydrogenase accessory factor|uniref:Molybdenum cofactor sulfurylase n=1 Tax=Pseudoalteromonas denitrificans DSM 6059 TaxID=1123010 RepID=A0A1I1L634_9GAMM|nr:xanthine dehydrogenase accessory protein XdhC [Pseudoalteromonas denitrificans]SFC68517.1 molybdenum cofactor sulfurylase [Pseudoalteromonas denitrificans DSM 6059]
MMIPNTNWIDAVKELSTKGEAYIIVTILGVQGSAPRNSGTKMVVSQNAVFDTIGGGHLEHKATKIALEFLAKGEQAQHLEHFPLGPKLGQCCGGTTSILFESFVSSHINIMLFGAGHVGHAIAPMLAGLPVKLFWVDEREELFPKIVATNTQHLVCDNPVDEVVNMPANSYYLVLTHNHQRDFDICSAVLKRNDFTYLGLIGSDTKWKRFQHRFEHRGFAKEQVKKIVCPVGLSNVQGKLPMEVAVSIVGEIITLYQSQLKPTENKQGIDWTELKSLVNEQEVLVE